MSVRMLKCARCGRDIASNLYHEHYASCRGVAPESVGATLKNVGADGPKDTQSVGATLKNVGADGYGETCVRKVVECELCGNCDVEVDPLKDYR